MIALAIVLMVIGVLMLMAFGCAIGEKRVEGITFDAFTLLAGGALCLILSATLCYERGSGNFAPANRLEVGAVYETMSAAKVEKGYAVVVKTEKGELIACVLLTEPPKVFTPIKGGYVPVLQNPTKK